jgi:6-pyruvoyltetrahydropterin/6-carboxytetrahydropterin synthase
MAIAFSRPHRHRQEPITSTRVPYRARLVTSAFSVEAMRTRVSRTFTFEAAHQLPWHPGRCRELHGHGYRIEVTVEGPVGPQGIVVDFDELGAVVEGELVARYDHRYLNDLLDNPTAEHIAHDAWKRLEAAGLRVVRLRLWETDDASVELLAD